MKKDFYDKLLNVNSEFTLDELKENLSLPEIIMDMITGIKILENLFLHISECLDKLNIDNLIEITEMNLKKGEKR